MKCIITKSGRLVATAAVIAITAASGCVATPLRTDAATSGVRAAEELGAEKVPAAALHLQLAKEQIGYANKFAAAGNGAKAESMLRRAEADAELAVALSREDSEKALSQAEVDRVRQLQEDNPSSAEQKNSSR